MQDKSGNRSKAHHLNSLSMRNSTNYTRRHEVSLYRCHLHLLLTVAHSLELTQCSHAIDYRRLWICVNKIKVTDYKGYERLHWNYRANVRDYSHVADPSGWSVVISHKAYTQNTHMYTHMCVLMSMPDVWWYQEFII